MANDLTTTDPQTTALETRWSRPQLTTSLTALVTDKRLWGDDPRPLPALSAEDRACAEQALAVYAAAPRGCGPETISRMVGEAAGVMPLRTSTDAEARLRLQVYQQDLADIDVDVLRAAFREARRTLTFFPTIAELRAIASRLPAPPRVFIAWRLRQLMAVRADAPIVDPVDAGEVSRLLDTMRPDTPGPTERLRPCAADRWSPTLDDYRALGLDEEEALEQWDIHQRQRRAAEAAQAIPRGEQEVALRAA